MTERQAGLTTMHEYRLRRDGFEKQAQERWELARWQVWRTLGAFCKRIGNTAQAFQRFPWEESEGEERKRKAEQYRVTAGEADALNKLFESLAAGGHKISN